MSMKVAFIGGGHMGSAFAKSFLAKGLLTGKDLLIVEKNKERHADEIQEIVTQYFMTQRIKLDMKNYEKQLKLLHQMLIYSMKCKQTTDLTNVTKLKDLVNDFIKSDSFAKVTNWGKEQILAGRPKHQVYQS